MRGERARLATAVALLVGALALQAQAAGFDAMGGMLATQPRVAMAQALAAYVAAYWVRLLCSGLYVAVRVLRPGRAQVDLRQRYAE